MTASGSHFRSARVIRAAVARVAAGERTSDVAASLGLPVTTLAWHVHRAGLTPGRRWHLRGALAVGQALADGAQSAQEAADRGGVALHTAQRQLAAMDRRGLIESTGRRRCALLWTLTDAGREWLAGLQTPARGGTMTKERA